MVALGLGPASSAAVGLDWHRWVASVNQLDTVADGLADFFGPFVREAPGRYGYGVGLRLAEPQQSSINYHPVNAQGGRLRGDLCVDINGSSLSVLTPEAAWEYVCWTRSIGAKATRIDLRWDDFEKIATPQDVQAAAEAGQSSPFRHTEDWGSGTVGQRKGRSAVLGKKGAAGSGCSVIVYDKDVESAGRINAVRWEARYYSDRAALLNTMLADAPDVETFAQKIGECIGGAVEFRDKGHSEHLDRCPLLPWWEQIVARLGSCRVYVPKEDSTYDSTLEWLESPAAYLAAVRDACEVAGAPWSWDQWLADLLAKGVARRNPRTERFSAEALRRLGTDCPF